ncbi:MAG: flagellar protein FliS [Planctomycetales bacterium]|nr:flagellar protein FliS [Planctomycetales bacterium]
MRRLDSYESSPAPWTRVEMLMAAFDGTISRLTQAQEFLAHGNARQADPLLLRSQRIILELYSGLDLRHGEIPENMRRLYLYVLGCIGMGRELDLPAALDVLGIIRNGLESIRGAAGDLERRGEVPPAPQQTQLLKHIVG